MENNQKKPDSTERTDTDVRLREYEEVGEGLEEMIAVVDRDYRYLLANRAFLKHRGMREKEQLVGQLIPEVLGKDVFERVVKQKLDECFQGKVVRYEMTYRYPEIGERVLSISYLPIEGPDGIDRVACILHDITEKRQAEELLRQSECQLVEAQHIAQIGSWNWDFQTNSRTWSEELYRIFGLDRKKSVPSFDSALIEFVHPDDRELVSSAVQTSIKNTQPCNFFYRIIRPDGAERMIHSQGNVITDDSGNPIRMFGTAQDITERRRAEDALREAERKYRDIFENADEGIFQTTPEGRYIAANPALARMHGFDSSEDLIRSRRDIRREIDVDQNRREEFKGLLEEHGIVRGFEHQLLRKDGSTIWVSVNARAVYDARGAIRYYEGTTQDINERKRAEARSAEFATLARKLSGARTPLDAGRIIAQTAGDLFEWDSCNLDLYDADRDLVHPMLDVDTIDGVRTDVTLSISGRKPTARSRRVIAHGPELLLRAEPVQFDGDTIPFGDKTRPSASIMSVPIRHADQVIGLLSIQSYRVNGYDPAALNNLQALADHCGEALNRIGAEQSLVESEERFRQMAENFEDVIWIADRDVKRVLYINPAYERVFGRSCESLYERLESFVENVHPDDRARMESMLERQRHGDLTPVEYRIVHPDGSVRWIQRRSFPIRNHDEEVYRVAGIAQDITERKRAEEALRASEKKYRDLVETAHDLIWAVDAQGRITFMNQAARTIYGCEPEELIGRSYLDLLSPEERTRQLDTLPKLLGSGEKFVLGSETEVLDRDGNRHTLIANAVLLFDQEGNAIGSMGTSADITDRKRADEALRESEERYRDLVENSRELICTHDLDGQVLSANPAAAAALGYDPDEFVRKRSVRDILAPEVRYQFDEYMARLSRDGVTSGAMLVKTKTGERRLWEYYNSLRTEGVDKPIVRGMARDITEQRRAEKAMSDLRRELELTMNSMEEGVHRVNLKGEIVFENPAAARMLGWEIDRLLGKPAHLTMHHTRPDGTPYPTEECPIYATFRDGVSRHVADEVFWRQDGTSFPVEYMTAPMRNDRNEIIATVVTFRNITARKEAEKALRGSEERYRELFENAKDAIYVHDLSGRYTSVNRAAEQLSGFTREEIMGKHFSNFVSPRDLKHVRTNLCRKLDLENETIYEVDMVTRTGRRVPVEVSSRLIFENGVAVGVQGTARDITDRKRAQEALRIYSQRLIQAQEAEREKVARELHDEIGQVLTAVRINLQAMQRSGGSNENIPRLDESIAIVDEALGRVRELSIELRPSLLDDLGLSAALRWYVDRYAQRTGIIAEVLNGFEEDGRLPRELETACFRIAQEALTNAARHAQAASVSVQLERSQERMLLTIIDDGIGFEVDKLRNNASAASALGLRGMEERARAVGGYIEIDSGLERGTRIRATFPLKPR